MNDITNNPACLFLCSLSLMLLITFFMNWASVYFYYIRWTRRRFSIMDLEFPSSARYYAKISTSIVMMKKGEFRGADPQPIPYNHLKYNIYLDFIFIWPTYLCVALMCLHAGGYAEGALTWFQYLALAQGLALLLDVVENFMILKTLKKPKWFLKADHSTNQLRDTEKDKSSAYKWYCVVVGAKWGIVLTGILFSLNVILYRFFMGDYTAAHIWYGVQVIGIIILFLIINAFLINKIKSPTTDNEEKEEKDTLPSFECPKGN